MFVRTYYVMVFLALAVTALGMFGVLDGEQCVKIFGGLFALIQGLKGVANEKRNGNGNGNGGPPVTLDGPRGPRRRGGFIVLPSRLSVRVRPLLAALVVLGALTVAMGAFRPWSEESYHLNTRHFAGQATATASPSSLNFTDLTTDNGRIASAYWSTYGTRHLSMFNTSAVTCLRYALDSAGSSDLTSTVTRAGTLRPQQGKTFGFTTSAISMRTATGTGSVTIDWDITYR